MKPTAGMLIVLLLGSVEAAFPCTLLFTTAGGARLAASNLDCGNVFPRVWFVPPSDGQHGRFCFGTDQGERIAEGGTNDEGLFIGVNALDEGTGWVRDPELPDWETWEGWYESGVPDGILAKCATVDEAVAVFQGYNLLTLAHVKFLLADRAGSSAIVEWSDGALRVVRRGDADHQVSTNFLTSSMAAADATCERFRIAEGTLSLAQHPATVETLRGILSATHLEFQTPTVMSSICDLQTGEIHVYYFHDFEQVVTFDLERELAAGPHGHLLSELFPVKPFVATVYEAFAKRPAS